MRLSSFAFAAVASLAPVFAFAGSIESDVAREGIKFDATLDREAAAPVQGREGGTKPTAYAQLAGAKADSVSNVPSPKGCPPGENPNGFWKGVGNAAAEIAGAGVGVVFGTVAGAAGAAYAWTLVGPVFVAAAVMDDPYASNGRNYGQILFDHLMSPVTWAIGGFKRARNATLEAIR